MTTKDTQSNVNKIPYTIVNWLCKGRIIFREWNEVLESLFSKNDLALRIMIITK